MKPRLIARLLLLAPLLVGSMATAQNLYKWVDDNGRVTYSDQPPARQGEIPGSRQNPRLDQSGAARQITDQDAQFKKRQDDATKKQAETAKKEQFEGIRQDSCARARRVARAARKRSDRPDERKRRKSRAR